MQDYLQQFKILANKLVACRSLISDNDLLIWRSSLEDGTEEDDVRIDIGCL